MASVDVSKDLAASVFSPDGRIFQVEYAQKAVDNMSTAIAIRGKDGVVTAVDNVMQSKLEISDAKARVSCADNHVGFTSTGVFPDCRSLLEYVQEEAFVYSKVFDEPIPAQKLAAALAEYVHMFTLGVSRPYGASVFLTAYDAETGPQVFLVEPSGLYHEYKGWAVGKNRQAAKAEIEKLKLDELSMEELVKEAARILTTVRDNTKEKNVRLEMGWVGKNTEGKHEQVPNNLVEEAEDLANGKPAKVAPKVVEKVAEKVASKVPEKVAEKVAEKAPEKVAVKSPEKVAPKAPEKVAAPKVVEKVAAKSPEKVAAPKVLEKVAAKSPEKVASKK